MVMRSGGVGDTITFTACAESLLKDHDILTDVFALRKRWGSHDWCAHNPYIAACASPPPPGPHIAAINMMQAVMSLRGGEEGFDVTNFGVPMRSRIEMAADAWARALGVPVRATLPTYKFRDDELQWGLDWYAKERVDPDRTIIFAPFPTNGWRIWPWPFAAEFIRLAEGAGYRCLIPFHQLDRLYGLGGYHLGAPNLPSLMAIMRFARLYVGVDTGPLHMAGTLGLPIVGLFGSTSGKAIAGVYPGAEWIQGTAKGCKAPCHKARRRGYHKERCMDIGCEAMWDIRPEAVWETVNVRLQNAAH